MVEYQMKQDEFYLSEKARETVELNLPDGRVITGRRGAELREFMRAIENAQEAMIIGAIVDGNLRELTFPISRDAVVTPLTLSDADGARIYRRSLTFLMEAAFKQCFPAGVLTIDHSVSSGGYFCQVEGLPELDRASIL